MIFILPFFFSCASPKRIVFKPINVRSICRSLPQLPFAYGSKRKEIAVRHLFNEETWEFIAKIICDLGKNIVSIGFASYFFKDLPLPFRIGFVILGVVSLSISVTMISKKGEK